LKLLAEGTGQRNGNGNGKGDVAVHDHDIVLALSPQKVEALAARFDRVRRIAGRKKPRFNALLSFMTEEPALVQPILEETLGRFTKRWILDEVVSTEGKPTELSYLVKLRKSMPGDALMSEIRSVVGSKLTGCDIELSEALEEQEAEATAKASG